jgi:hypothetical protein
VEDIAVVADGGVVHQRVDLPCCRGDAIDALTVGLMIRNVQDVGRGLAACAPNFSANILDFPFSIESVHDRAFARKFDGNCSADALRCAGDDTDTAFQPHASVSISTFIFECKADECFAVR